MLLSPDVKSFRCSTYIVISTMTFKHVYYSLKSLVVVASFTISLSGRLVLYTTHRKTLLKVDYIANKAFLANLIEFSPL